MCDSVVLLVILLPILTSWNQEIVPDQDPLSLRESDSNNEETGAMTSEEEAMSVQALSHLLGVRTVSFLTNHQLELSIRALQAA